MPEKMSLAQNPGQMGLKKIKMQVALHALVVY